MKSFQGVRWTLLTIMIAGMGWAWATACSGGGTDGDADADIDGDSDSDADGANVLEAIGDATRYLEFGEATDLAVRYLDAQGSPIRSAVITYEVTGDARGSRLDASTATTNDQGIATMRLVAGSTTTSFQVQVVPPLGNTVAFHINVSDEEVGTIVVRMSYEGEQSFTTYRALRFTGFACETFNPDELPEADAAAEAVSRLSDRPRFDSVLPGDDYTVTVVAEVDGHPEGFGCVHNVEVLSQQVTEINVRIEDIERLVRIEGTYELESLLDFGETLPPSVTLGIDIFDELTDDHAPDRSSQEDIDEGDDMCGQDPGAFIVDYVMRQTCGWECLGGEDFDDCSEINHPLGDLCLLYEENFQSWDGCEQGLPSPLIGGCGVWEYAAVPAQRLINEQIERYVPSFVTNMLNIIGDLSRAINDAHIFSLLNLEEQAELGAPFTHTLTEMLVRLRDFDGVFHEYRFDLADVGFSSLTASETADITGARLTLPDHRFSLHFGELIQFIYINGLLPLLGYDSTAEMLQSWIDCNAVAETVHGWFNDIFGFSPGVGSLRGYCDSGLVSAGRAIENYLGRAVDTEGTLILAGHATGDEVTEEGLAQTLVDGEWEGQWGEGDDSGEVNGTFTGVHR